MSAEQVKHASEGDFDTLTARGVSVVDFWADWCGPCHILAPTIEELARKYQGRAAVLKVNVDENPGLAARFGIHGIPTVVFLQEGKEVERLVGVRPLSELESVLARYLEAPDSG